MKKPNWRAVSAYTQRLLKQQKRHSQAACRHLVDQSQRLRQTPAWHSVSEYTKHVYNSRRIWLGKAYKGIKMNLTETKISSEPVFNGTFVSIARDTVRLPNGKESKRVVVRHPGAACVLAVTASNEVVFVRQWRYATGQPLLEIPAGKLDDNEDPAVCALRELAEETPYAAESVKLLYTFYTSPGFCDEKMYLYLAEGVSETSALEPDQDEFVETVLLSREQVKDAIRSNMIQDAKTLIALQHWLLHH